MILKLKKDLVIETVNNKITIFDSQRLIVFSFNETGSYIFKKIRKGFPTDKIIQAMVKRYQIEKEIAQKDFEDFFNLLLKKKLVFLSKRKK